MDAAQTVGLHWDRLGRKTGLGLHLEPRVSQLYQTLPVFKEEAILPHCRSDPGHYCSALQSH